VRFERAPVDCPLYLLTNTYELPSTNSDLRLVFHNGPTPALLYVLFYVI
jgi:hypothetical protein